MNEVYIDPPRFVYREQPAMVRLDRIHPTDNIKATVAAMEICERHDLQPPVACIYEYRKPGVWENFLAVTLIGRDGNPLDYGQHAMLEAEMRDLAAAYSP